MVRSLACVKGPIRIATAVQYADRALPRSSQGSLITALGRHDIATMIRETRLYEYDSSRGLSKS